MYLFSRSTVAALGREFDAITPAVEIAELVTGVTGKPVSVFTARFGAPAGAVMWTTLTDSFAELHADFEKLGADPGYMAKVESMNGLFMTPAEDYLGRLMNAPADAAQAPQSRFYGITRASMLNGKYAEALEFGVRAADYIGTSLGTVSVFSKSQYNGFGDVSWIVGFDATSGVDEFADWQMGDAGYHEIIAEAGSLFVEGSGETLLIERLN